MRLGRRLRWSVCPSGTFRRHPPAEPAFTDGASPDAYAHTSSAWHGTPPPQAPREKPDAGPSNGYVRYYCNKCYSLITSVGNNSGDQSKIPERPLQNAAQLLAGVRKQNRLQLSTKSVNVFARTKLQVSALAVQYSAS